MIPTFFKKLFGDNYLTTFWGFWSKVSMVGAFLSLNPKAFDWLPDDIQGYVTGFFITLWTITSFVKDTQTKDKNEEFQKRNQI